MPPPQRPFHLPEPHLPEALAREVGPEVGPEGQRLSLKNLLFPIGLSVAVLAVILWVTWDPEALREMGRRLSPGLLALAIGIVGLRVLLGGARLRHISQRTLSLYGGIRSAIAWDFMSAVTPSAIGGAPLAAYFVAKDNRIPVGDATAIMLFSMLMDQVWFAISIPFILLASFFLDVFPPATGAIGAGTLTAYFVGMMVWAGFFAYATLIRPSVLEAVAKKVVRVKWLRRFEEKVLAEFHSLRERTARLREQPPRFFVGALGYSVGIWFTRYLTLLFIVLSVFPALDGLTFLVRTVGMYLTSMVVPTPGGSGGIEALYILFFDGLLPGGLLGPTLLTWRLVAYYLFIAAGLAVTAQLLNRRITAPEATEPPPPPASRNGAVQEGVEAGPLHPDPTRNGV
ncbi:MAG: lysylphosphatidylglycerol synthase transmembrane domain-containing protein [Rhodothermales bacterium]|nr:lysylphosphatidylglycerol synthase transmembrane domain-containing protein [Rhodothermales bacterium]